MVQRWIKYAVGQPMGALSSWAMLAITHHFLWQWAAWRSNEIPTFKWYKDYAVLGDDSASLNPRIVQEYLKICSELGVSVNLSKSLLSYNGCLEFAKRFYIPRGDASPISLGELTVSTVNFSVMANWPRKRPIRIADLFTLMGYRHSTLSKINRDLCKLPKKVRNMIIVVKSPWGPFPSDNLIHWLKLTSLTRHGRVLDFYYVSLLLYELAERIEKRLLRIFFMHGRQGGNILVSKSQRHAINQYYQKISKDRNRNLIPVPSPVRPIGILDGKLITDEPTKLRLTRNAFIEDSVTFLAVNSIVYEPLRCKTYLEAGTLLNEVQMLKRELLRRFYFIDESESLEFWTRIEILEEKAYLLRENTERQDPSFTSEIPSAKSVVKLFNRARRLP